MLAIAKSQTLWLVLFYYLSDFNFSLCLKLLAKGLVMLEQTISALKALEKQSEMPKAKLGQESNSNLFIPCVKVDC